MTGGVGYRGMMVIFVVLGKSSRDVLLVKSNDPIILIAFHVVVV